MRLRLLRLVVAFGLFCCAFAIAVANAQTLKTWSFPLQRGTLSVSLMHGSGDRLVLSFGNLPCGACAVPGEVGGVLGKVLHSMTLEHMDPHRITMIEARVTEANAQRALAEAALRSPEWRTCVAKRGCGGEGLVVKLLNESRAFGDLDEALHPYGLTLRVVSAEKISVDRVSMVPGLTLPPGVKTTARVPTDGSLELLVEPRK